MKIAALTAAAAMTALLVAGCGGDNKSVTTNTTAAAAANGATTTAKAGATTTAGSGSDAGTTSPSFSGDSNNKFCQTARDLENSNLGDALGSENGDLKNELQQIHSAFDDLKSSAPSEIKNDVATLATAFDKLNDFYAKYDYDQTKLAAAAAKDPKVAADATSAITDPAFTAAAGRITAYATQVCGIDTGDDSSTTSA